mmetsp:Transcript_1717/g.4915  ORF Transcript_1717/g.4915 Transcript_1717/m.4915 type:complete len:222 (+) Transcript_1717:540-1205(+)
MNAVAAGPVQHRPAAALPVDALASRDCVDAPRRHQVQQRLQTTMFRPGRPVVRPVTVRVAVARVQGALRRFEKFDQCHGVAVPRQAAGQRRLGRGNKPVPSSIRRARGRLRPGDGARLLLERCASVHGLEVRREAAAARVALHAPRRAERALDPSRRCSSAHVLLRCCGPLRGHAGIAVQLLMGRHADCVLYGCSHDRIASGLQDVVKNQSHACSWRRTSA